MFFDEIIHGTQYYRSPTPLPFEWEYDIANLEKYNIDAFQIRMNWRWNERRENEYDFSDVDKLLELAEKNGRKVIMKFLLECAPQYIYEKYDGTRIGSKGERLRPGAHGAFYGGWLPCFTNPKVQERAIKFVEEVAKRYSGNKNIILWHTWNEIRNRPVDECFCPHCRRAFGKYLEKKFGTVEALNAHYGAAEDSFDTINLPVMAHGFWDIYEFKKFKGSYELSNYLKFVYDAIRKYDSDRPIMSHVGVCSAFQDNIGDVCDDYTVSKAVDFWGTSLPFYPVGMDSHDKRCDMMMLTDFLRSVDKNYFIHEIYPGHGRFRDYDTPFDLKYKLYAGLAGGAKGIVYWQYRAERVGIEQDCAGIMHMDGTPREVAFEARDFGANLKKDMQYFKLSEPDRAEIAIVYDFDSQLMGEIEENCVEDFNLKKSTGLHYYHKAHKGTYQLLRDAGYNVEYVGVTNPDQFENYKVLIFPYYTMLDREIVPYLEKFLENGGIVIADEGFGMRQKNTWMQPYDIEAKPVLDARLIFRHVTEDESIDICGKRTKILPYRAEYRVNGAKVLKSFDNGKDAMFEISYGKGKFYLCGFSAGFSYLETHDEVWKEHIDGIVSMAGVEKYQLGDFSHGVYERRMKSGDNTIVFIFNTSDEDKTFDLGKSVVAYGADAVIDGTRMTVKSGEVGYAVI